VHSAHMRTTPPPPLQRQSDDVVSPNIFGPPLLSCRHVLAAADNRRLVANDLFAAFVAPHVATEFVSETAPPPFKRVVSVFSIAPPPLFSESGAMPPPPWLDEEAQNAVAKANEALGAMISAAVLVPPPFGFE
jgi:hypothetical protein